MNYCEQPVIDGSVLVLGDLHGLTHVLIEKLDHLGWPGDHIICLGDIGLGFPNMETRVQQLDAAAKSHDTHIWFIRGNHDNPDEWEKEHEYSNVHLLRDNTVAIINNAQWYIVGGGVSLDRVSRTEGEDWWKDEEMNFSVPKHVDVSKIYGVLSHVGPTPPDTAGQILYYYMSRYGWLIKDPLEREKETLQKIMTVLRPTEWYFGHFHEDRDFSQDACRCHCLDELVLQQMKDVLVKK